MTKWTPERMRTPNGIDDAREMIVSIEAHGHPDQVDDPPPHSHLLNLALFSLNQAESQRAELEAARAAMTAFEDLVKHPWNADTVEVWHEEALEAYDALRSQHATSGEDARDDQQAQK